MSAHPNTKLISSVSRRRKLWAFVSVAAATFFVLSMIWPLSVRSWKTESDIGVALKQRVGAGDEFQQLLGEVVKRHTTPAALARIVRQHGMLDNTTAASADEIGHRIHERLEIVLIDDPSLPNTQLVRVGIDGSGFDGKATEKETFFVNMLATTLARDFMTSPLAGILPTDPLPTSDVEALQQRYAAIEDQANSLLAQIQTNLRDSSAGFGGANQMLASNSPQPAISAHTQQKINDLRQQRDRIASYGGDSTLELAAIDQQIDDLQIQTQPASNRQNGSAVFSLASHSQSSSQASSGVEGLVSSLRTTVSDLAHVTADACSAAETASRTNPAFSVLGVEKRPARPVGAIPQGSHLMLLLLASTVFATIVTAAYKPFAQRGFESIQEVADKLDLPVIATLGRKHKSNQTAATKGFSDSSISQSPISNQIVSVSKWVLFAGLMLTIGFCLVNADIRNAFCVGPFHGFAQIVWTLQGN